MMKLIPCLLCLSALSIKLAICHPLILEGSCLKRNLVKIRMYLVMRIPPGMLLKNRGSHRMHSKR